MAAHFKFPKRSKNFKDRIGTRLYFTVCIEYWLNEKCLKNVGNIKSTAKSQLLLCEIHEIGGSDDSIVQNVQVGP